MKGKRWLALLAAAALVLALAAVGSARQNVSYQVYAQMTVNEEVPAPKHPSLLAGNFGGVIQGGQGGVFNGILGYVLRPGIRKYTVVAAHIHHAMRGKVGPVVLTLCSGNCPAGAKTLQFAVSSRLLGWMRAGQTYANVHTKDNPAGELRGQIGVGKPLG